jgi:hypothetical protein
MNMQLKCNDDGQGKTSDLGDKSVPVPICPVHFPENQQDHLRLEAYANHMSYGPVYESVSKSFRTENLERELQMVRLSATRCSYIAIL